MRRISVEFLLCIVAVLLAGILTSSRAGPSSPPTGGGGGSEQALAIIVNQSNPVDNCSFEELRKIFLGERSHWPNGRRITVVMLDPAQPERNLVLREIYGMTDKDLNNHFIQ